MIILIILITLIAFWVTCSVLTYGLTFAYFQLEYKDIAHLPGTESDSRRIARVMAIAGPIGLAVSLACGGAKHGLKFRK